MDELEIKKVPFMGTELMAARDANGQIWAGVSYICNGIGLTKHQKDRQVATVQTDEVLQEGCLKFEAGVFDPNNETVVLKLDFVPLWLAKINITPAMKAEHPEVAETLKQYQLKAKDVLAAAFLPNHVSTNNVPPLQPESAGGVAQLLKVLRATMKDNNQPPEIISQTIKELCEQFGLQLPANFVRRNPFEQLALVGVFWGK
ncbi:MAG: hypothetical protein HFE97_12435 [Oscillospiraceae bacterium]|nr:hypothetical protein [Oscillospiraceae bacterium]MCI8914835.1 hypothetical protein [Lawsonibacter sp.]